MCPMQLYGIEQPCYPPPPTPPPPFPTQLPGLPEGAAPEGTLQLKPAATHAKPLITRSNTSQVQLLCDAHTRSHVHDYTGIVQGW